MPLDTQSNSPATLSPAVSSMQDELTYARTVAAGWPTVNTYLTQFAAEDAADFVARKKRPNFCDFLNPVVDAVSGRIFRNEPRLSSAGRIAEMWENINLAGDNGPVFLHTLLEDALVAGQAFILIDYPIVAGNPTRGQRLAQKLRSYWVPIKLDQVTNFHFEWDQAAGKMVLTLFVYHEVLEEVDGFKIKQVDYWRVYRNDRNGQLSYERWRRDRSLGSNEFGKPVRVDGPNPIVGVTELPIVSVNLRPQSRFVSRPVFLELAQQSIDYYLTTSDMSYAHEKTSYPILVLTGFAEKTPDGKPIEVGPNAVLKVGNPQAKAEYVAGDGKGVELGLKIREAIRSQMGILGMSFLEQETKMAATAQSKMLDVQTEEDWVATVTGKLQDAVNLALEFTAEYEDVSPAPTISFEPAEHTSVKEEITVRQDADDKSEDEPEDKSIENDA